MRVISQGRNNGRTLDDVELTWDRGTTLAAKACLEGAPGLDKPKEEQPGGPEADSGSEQSTLISIKILFLVLKFKLYRE